MMFVKGMYDKEYKFTDDNGVEQSVIVKPLTGKSIGKMFKLAQAFEVKKDVKAEDIDSNEILAKIVEKDLVQDIFDIVKETIIRGYPGQDVEAIDEFTAKNMFNMLPIIFEVNFGKNAK